MEKATLEFYPNGLQLLYVVQGGMGGWGKGSSLQEATKNFKKFNKRTKPSFVYAFKQGTLSLLNFLPNV